MAIKGEVLDALLAAGATAEMIVAAVKADAAEDERKAAHKREVDAARQRRHRLSRGVTRTRRDPPIEEIIPPVSSDDETPPAPKTKSGKVAKPADVKDQTWRDFQAVRRAKRAPLTETAMEGIEREAAKAGLTLETALSECVNRNWQSFKAEWVHSTGPPGRFSAPAPTDANYLDSLLKRQPQAVPP